ncbi:hypothetical protein [Chryseobacterium sp.]|uniref:hypothetical protein n=1 Tax=Chryseobacterium sp. TaxID=1871047 RepID=UPI0028A17432|nr:hypothetical protein [Chryseobacterium sp.]
MSLIDKHYNHYLEKVELKEDQMMPVQKTETKRAFVAGMAEMFVQMLEGLGTGVTLEDYKNEIADFWKNEVEKFK